MENVQRREGTRNRNVALKGEEGRGDIQKEMEKEERKEECGREAERKRLRETERENCI